MEPRDLDVAWAAGFVDGEGAVMLVYARPGKRNRRGYEEITPGRVTVHVRVTQVDIDPLYKLQDLFGGQVKAVNMDCKARVKNKQPIHEWNIFGGKAIEVLRQLSPYLMVKKAHADLAIDYYETCNGARDSLDVKLLYWEEMQSLQHKSRHLVKREGE